jgi:hypothetical protein
VSNTQQDILLNQPAEILAAGIQRHQVGRRWLAAAAQRLNKVRLNNAVVFQNTTLSGYNVRHRLGKSNPQLWCYVFAGGHEALAKFSIKIRTHNRLALRAECSEIVPAEVKALVRTDATNLGRIA